jgi:hypothetical protein
MMGKQEKQGKLFRYHVALNWRVRGLPLERAMRAERGTVGAAA